MASMTTLAQNKDPSLRMRYASASNRPVAAAIASERFGSPALRSSGV
jgi:hypothetical protein